MKSIKIDSSHIHEITVEIDIDGVSIKEKKQSKNLRGSQVILQTIDDVLKKTEKSLLDIDEMYIHPGPGSYTGLRVGATIANTVAFCLKVPVNKKPVGEFVYPSYE